MKLWHKPAATDLVGGKKKQDPVSVTGEGAPEEAPRTEVREEEILSFLDAELARRKKERRGLELQWQLNADFLLGYQNCEINPYREDVEEQSREYEHWQRSCFNRIAPIIDTRMANLDCLRFDMTVSPATNEADDYEKAGIATKLLSYLKSTTGFDSVRRMLIHWSELCGTAFILSYWDRDAGAPISAQGQDGERETRHEGDVRYGLLTPYEVYPESVCKQTVADQRSLLLEQVMSVSDAEQTYGIRVTGEEIDTYALTPVENGAGFGGPGTAFAFGTRKVPDSVRVLTYFERSTKAYPEGRLIIAVGREVWFCGALPYEEIPVVALKCKEVAGQFFGRSVIQDLIPLQRAYNGCKNKIHDYIRTLAANPLLIPEGSVEDIDAVADCGLAPGTVIEYDASRGKPTPLVFQSISNEVREECESIVREMEYVAGVSQLMVTGTGPSGVTSGTAIARLQGIDNTRLSLTADAIRDAMRSLAVLWLKIYHRHAKTARILSIAGTNEIAGVFTFCGGDINSFDVRFDTENELRNSEEQQKENFLYAMSAGLFNDENGCLPRAFRSRALELLRLGQYGELMSEGELQMQNARRENRMLAVGRIPTLDLYDDDALHLSEHRRFALQMRFRLLREKDPALAAAFDEHIREHARRLAKQGAASAVLETAKERQ